MTTFTVTVTPHEPGEKRTEEDAAFEREAVWRAVQEALDRAKLGGTFRVVGPADDEKSASAALPPDTLKAFFTDLRGTAQDSLTLLRILGVPSNAKVVEVWRKFASFYGSDEDLNKAIAAKIDKLAALNEVLREVSDALHDARDVASDLDNTIKKAENAGRDARR